MPDAQERFDWKEALDDLTDETHYCHDLSPHECKKSGHLKVTRSELASLIAKVESETRSRAIGEAVEVLEKAISMLSFKDSWNTDVVMVKQLMPHVAALRELAGKDNPPVPK